jgi:signal peptidase I
MKGTEFDGKAIMNDMDDKFKFNNFIFYKEKAGNHEHVFQLDDDNYFKTDFGPEKIPEGSYFVMGDNRDFSSDSRFWGVVPHHLIKGRAVLVWFSMIFPFTDNPYKFRPHRIGTKID